MLSLISDWLRPDPKVIHILGDSHIGEFQKLELFVPGYKVNVCCVQGATASGLENPHSKTTAGPTFEKYLSSRVKPKEWVMFHLGEVDCGFLMWVRAEREKITINEQLSYTVDNYRRLIDKALAMTTRVMVLSVIPQTIKDGAKFGNVANLRGQITATQLERTKLSVDMNNQLQKYARKVGAHYIDLDDALLNPETGLVRSEFLNQNPEDHHLDSQLLIKLVSEKLNAVLK